MWVDWGMGWEGRFGKGKDLWMRLGVFFSKCDRNTNKYYSDADSSSVFEEQLAHYIACFCLVPLQIHKSMSLTIRHTVNSVSFETISIDLFNAEIAYNSMTDRNIIK